MGHKLADGSDSSDYEVGLARIVDWRNEEVLNDDLVVTAKGKPFIRASYGCMVGDETVIRINFDALPKQRTMTREEVEKEFGVKVVD